MDCWSCLPQCSWSNWGRRFHPDRCSWSPVRCPPRNGSRVGDCGRVVGRLHVGPSRPVRRGRAIRQASDGRSLPARHHAEWQRRQGGGHFERWGPGLLILTEFIPSIRTLAPSLAGAEKLSPPSFLLYSALGAALWTVFYLGIGVAFRSQIAQALVLVGRSGKIAVVLIAATIAVYFVIRWQRRRRSVKASG